MVHRYVMVPSVLKTFPVWLLEHKTFHEVSELFSKHQINMLFDQALERRIAELELQSPAHMGNTAVSYDLSRPRLDWVGYISRSVKGAGVPTYDLDGAVNRIVTTFLVTPGRLFSGWTGEGPIVARFKTSVRNAAISIAKENVRKYPPAVSIHEPGIIVPARPSSDTALLDLFTTHLRNTVGDQAAWLFQQLTHGVEKRELVGMHNLTSYRVKSLVSRIKRELLAFSHDDPVFAAQVRKMLGEEELTFQRRRNSSKGK